MLKSSLITPYILLLVAGIAFLWWYPLQVAQAIGGFNWAEGEFVGSHGQSQIFAFSIFGGLLSLGLMTYWIWNSEGKRRVILPIAFAVAYICTISATMWYEQVYANLWDVANHTNYWLDFYANPPKLLQVLVDISLLAVAYPWMRRTNLKLVALFTLLTLALFAAWFAIGFGFPITSPLAYFLNGGSRVFSQLAISVTVRSKNADMGVAPGLTATPATV